MTTHQITAFIFGILLAFKAFNNLEHFKDVRRSLDFSVQMSEKRTYGHACTYHKNTELLTHFIVSR